METVTGNLGGIERYHLRTQRWVQKGKTQLGLNVVKNVKGIKKGQSKYTGNKRKTQFCHWMRGGPLDTRHGKV